MKKIILLANMATLGALISLSGCGKTSAPEDNTRDNQASKIAATLPEGAMIAVPVGADGKELIGQAQMRLLPKAGQPIDADSMASAFSKGREPDRLADELDQSSSTESYRGWQNYRQVGYGHGNAGGQGYGYNRPNYGCQNYQSYQPTYYYGGSMFSWLFQNQYQTPNMNYYYYQRPSIWPQYQGSQYPYGQNQGSTYPYGGDYQGGQNPQSGPYSQPSSGGYGPTPVSQYPSGGDDYSIGYR